MLVLVYSNVELFQNSLETSITTKALLKFG
jgi:hypothetical protein